MRLSAHFTLDELTASQTAARKGIDNTPSASILSQLTLTADRMEKVRAVLGNRAISVSSGYRSPALNKAVGGVPTSHHCFGYAVDFRVAGLSIAEVNRIIAASDIPFDQLIDEYSRWTHISFAPTMRRQVFNKR